MKKELKEKIGFIGGGNMAAAIIQGLINSDYLPSNILVYDIDQTRISLLSKKFKITTTNSYADICNQSNVIILAVKPQVIKQVAIELSKWLNKNNSIMISIAAGISTSSVLAWISNKLPVIRCMPNMPALIQTGITALYAAGSIPIENKILAQFILESVGTICWVEEEADINRVTAISGSGPAYFFYLLEILEEKSGIINKNQYINLLTDLKGVDSNIVSFSTNSNLEFSQDTAIKILMQALILAGEKIGLKSDLAFSLVKQTAIGALHMALSSSDNLPTLRALVTSKGGTTEAALTLLAGSPLASWIYAKPIIDANFINNMYNLFYKAVFAAWQRSIELSHINQ